MNDLKFTCPTCGQPILVAASEAGRKLACPSCKAQLTIPNAQPASRATSAAAASGELRVADSAPPATPGGPQPAAREDVTLPPLPSTPAEPSVLPVPPAEGKSSLRLEPAEAPASAAAAHTAAELRRVLGPEQDAPPEPTVTAPAEPTVEPTTGVVRITPSPSEEVSATADGAPPPAQIAILTSDLKRTIVKAARELIAEAERWLPGVGDKGKLAYAAKQVKGGWKPLEPGNDEATHHSLMGAVLHELHRRNVAPTATGRTEFLDGDIPNAIRKVVPEEPDAGEGDETPKARAARLMRISHGQCLQVLDLLEREYAAKGVAEAEAPARSESRGASLDELLVRADRDEVMTVTEVLRAVHAELVAMSHRITELEKTGGGSAPVAASE